MFEFLDFVVSFNIHGKVSPEIIRNPVLIPVGVEHPFRSSKVINCNGQGYWPARTIDNIQGYAKTMVNFVIAD